MNRISSVTVLLVCQVFAVETVYSQRDTASSPGPISLHFLKPNEPAPAGVQPRSPSALEAVFVVTNHTAKTVVVNLLAVEVKSGSNWITQMRPHGPLLLSATNATRMPGATNPFIPGLTTAELGPHQTAYSTISFSGLPTASGPQMGDQVGCGMNYLGGQPTGPVWRLIVSVQEKLTGLAGAPARLIRYPDVQARLAANGVTNAPVNPFSSAYSYFGKATRVSSEEVPNQ